MFALVDCNNFYVSCERVFNPKLVGKPVIVLSNNDGCIIARSKEAKQLGLKMAEPAFLKQKFLRDNHVQVFSSNYTLYGDMSQRVMATLSHFTPDIEVYSIDEAFLSFSSEADNLSELADKIKQQVEMHTGIPVSVGIGPTKTLAKIANMAAKQNDGVFIINNNGHRDSVIRNTPINKVWGIGRQYSSLLKANQIRTAYDYTLQDDNWIKHSMKVFGLRIKRELLGESCIPLDSIVPAKKAIATTRAFGQKTSDLKLVKEAVATYAVRCCEKLRRQHSLANLLTVFIHTDPFNPGEPQINKTRTLSLPVASNNNTELVKLALLAVESIFETGYMYKKAGVIVEGLHSETSFQTNIFENDKRIRNSNLVRSMDEINKKLGRDTVKLAVQGDGKKWQLRQEKLSKRYTTNWNEIIEVKA